MPPAISGPKAAAGLRSRWTGRRESFLQTSSLRSSGRGTRRGRRRPTLAAEGTAPPDALNRPAQDGGGRGRGFTTIGTGSVIAIDDVLHQHVDPYVMIGRAGPRGQARSAGPDAEAWVKTSARARASSVVSAYLEAAELQEESRRHQSFNPRWAYGLLRPASGNSGAVAAADFQGGSANNDPGSRRAFLSGPRSPPQGPRSLALALALAGQLPGLRRGPPLVVRLRAGR